MLSPRVARTCLCVALLLLLAVFARSQELKVLPQPESVKVETGQMLLRDGMTVRYHGEESERLHRAVARLYDRLSSKLGFVVMQEPVVEGAPTLDIISNSKGEKTQRAQEDESYSLIIGPKGAELRAPQEIGILRGLETLYQLSSATPDGFGAMPAVSINDRPRFAWRGLLFDVARHYMPVEQIEREIDGLAAVKMNVLHLHLSDDQSFRVESKKFPELTRKSSHGQFYTTDDIKHLVAYAQDRGVRIVPEFDVPGHSTAWLAALPELAVNKPDSAEIFVRFGGYKNTLDPSNPKLLKVLDKLFGEMAALFPDEYFHIGGDEVDYSYWKNSVSVAKLKERRKLADDRAVQAYFNTELEKILRKHGKKMAGWNEILHADLPKTTLVHSWTGVKPLEEAVNRGYPVICSLGYYLDWFMPASFYYNIDPLHPSPETFDSLIGVLPVGTNTKGLLAQKAQAESFQTSAEAKRLVLGGEAAEWTELAAPWTIDSVIWPRMAAIAERLWSPDDVKDVSSLYRRLDTLSLELSDLGISPDEGFRKMRERLAGGAAPAQTLSVLADIVEPTKYYTRNVRQKKAGVYKINSPLNRLVDAIPPESATARRFGVAVSAYLNNGSASDLAYIQSALEQWRANEAPLWRTVKTNPRLSELTSLVDQLRFYRRAAEDALGYLERGEQAPASWVSAQQILLTPAANSDADLELAIAPHVRRLVEAASKAPKINRDAVAASR